MDPSMEKDNQIVAGITSFGMSGLVFHGPLLDAHPGFHLKSVLQRTKDTAMDKYPDIQIVRTMEELVHDPEVELIVVNAVNETHYPHARMALEAGKHVVIEKPMTNTIEEGKELIELARQNDLVLTVFQNRRWDSDFLTIQKILQDGLLGRLVEFNASWDRYRNYIQPNTWKEETGPGSGLLYNLGPHLIDQAVVLFGMPDAVAADIRAFRTDSKVDDFYEIYLQYPEVKVRLHSSYLVREPYPRFTLHGTLGSFVKYGLDVQEAALKVGENPDKPGWGIEDAEIWGTLNTEIDGEHVMKKIESEPGNYMTFYDNVFDAIRKGAPLAVIPQESLLNIHIIQLAFQSSKEGRALPCNKDLLHV
jgi:predicted dehydrogenase